jgi:hypothetical protein
VFRRKTLFHFRFHFRQKNSVSISVPQISVFVFIFSFRFHFSAEKSESFRSTFIPTCYFEAGPVAGTPSTLESEASAALTDIIQMDL